MFLNFVNNYRKLVEKYDFVFPDEGFLGLFGVTFNNGILESKKLYFDVQKPISLDDFIFPSKKHLYEKYIAYIDRTRSLSDCVSIKHNINTNKIVENFHIKFNDKFSSIDNDCLNSIPLKNCQKAISVEFNENKEEIRRYYYLRDKNLIFEALRIMGINEDPANIKYIEYTANPEKGILVFNDENLHDLIYKSITSNAPQELIGYCNDIYDTYKAIPILYGKYANEKKYTVYWDLNTSNFYPDTDFFKFITK